VFDSGSLPSREHRLEVAPNEIFAARFQLDYIEYMPAEVSNSAPFLTTGSSSLRPSATSRPTYFPSKQPGAIVEGVVGGLAFIGALLLAIYLLRKRRREKARRISNDAPFGLVVSTPVQPASMNNATRPEIAASSHTKPLPPIPAKKALSVSLADVLASSSASAKQKSSAAPIGSPQGIEDGPPPYHLLSPRSPWYRWSRRSVSVDHILFTY
jgi:hypothetical protein